MKAKKALLTCFFLISIIFACKKDEPKPQPPVLPKSVSLSIYASNSNSQISVTLYFTKNTDTVAGVYTQFYISKDKHFAEGEDVKIGAISSYISDATRSFSYYMPTPPSLENGDYFLIAKYRATNDSNYFYTNTGIYIEQQPRLITISGIAAEEAQYYETDNSSINISYKSDISEFTDVTFEAYFSKDSSIFDQGQLVFETFSKKVSVFGSVLGYNFEVPTVFDPGVYYLMLNSYYYSSGAKVYLGVSKTPITIKLLSEVVSVTGLTLSKTSFLAGDEIDFNIKLTNSSSKTLSPTFTYYLSEDKILDNNDISIYTQNKVVAYNNSTTSYDQEVRIFSNIGSGNYYLLIKEGYKAYSNYIASPMISIEASVMTITGISLPGSASLYYSGNSIDVTVNYNANKALSVTYYLSETNVPSSSDYFMLNETLAATSGINTDKSSMTIPVDVPIGTYYVYAKYYNNLSGDYEYTFNDKKFSVIKYSAILYRNTSVGAYSNFYLFINDKYVTNLTSDNYSYKEYTNSCPSIKDLFDNSYYIYNGAVGSYTYKLRSENSLSTGVTIKSGSFSITSGNCTPVDVD